MSYASQVLPTMRSTTFILDTFILSTIAISVASIGSSPSASEQDISTADFQVPGISVRDFDQSQVKSSETSPQHRDKVFPEKRYLRSSASEQDLVKSKESADFDDGLFGKTHLPLAAQDLVAAKEPEQLLHQDTRRLSGLFIKPPCNRGKERCKRKRKKERTQWIMVEVAILLGFSFILAIAYVCIKRRRTKAAAARVDVDVEAPPDRDDAFDGDSLNGRSAKELTDMVRTLRAVEPVPAHSATKTPAPSARYQQLMRESEGVVARGMTAARVLLAMGQATPVIGPICEVAQDILRSVEEHSRKADDVLMAGRRTVDVLGALQQMSANAEKLEFGNADLVESKMRKLKGLLCDFKLAVDAFGQAGWLKRAFHQRGHVNSLTKLDKEIATCLESLKLDYKLAVDADILERTYQMEQSITMLVAKRCSETREDPAAAAAILARTPVAIAEVVENAHVPEDELLIEMRELSGEVSKGLAKILDSHDKVLDSMQQGHATILEKLETLTKRDRARRLKNAHMEDNEVELDFVEVEPFAGGGQGSVHKAEFGGETVCLKKFLLVGVGALSARDKILSSFKKEVGIMDKLHKHPRTVDFVGICTTDASFLGIVTQYLPNGSLRSVLDDARGDAITPKIDKRSDAITPKIQLNWAKDIAIGMAYLHKEGVLHRDLKSQNVLLTHEWRCKITDFGISKSEALKTIATTSTMHGGAGISGTFPFTAPEAFSPRTRFTAKCDVYSYAIVLWEIWDRGKPWDGLDLPEIYTAVCINKERPKVPDLMPVEVRALMCRAWSQNAAARPDFEDIVTQLYIIEGKGL